MQRRDSLTVNDFIQTLLINIIMQIAIQIRSHMIWFIIRIYGRRYFFFYWMNDIYKTPFKVVENVGNPPLCSGVIAVLSESKSHTLTVLLAVFASQPRWRHKLWKNLFHVYSPHLSSGKLFTCTQLIAVLSGPLFISWAATDLTMSGVLLNRVT